jgi:hypothetical protein
VFSHDAWLDGASVSCQVYSRTGEFITEAIIDEGIYRRVYPSNFFKNSFYVLLTKKDDDGSIFLAKIPVQVDSRPQAAPMAPGVNVRRGEAVGDGLFLSSRPAISGRAQKGNSYRGEEEMFGR